MSRLIGRKFIVTMTALLILAASGILELSDQALYVIGGIVSAFIGIQGYVDWRKEKGAATNMSEFDLTAEEQAQIAADCAGIIGADKTTATVYRPQGEGAGGFWGASESEFDPIDTIAVDFKTQPSSDVLEPGCDTIADTPGDRSHDFVAGEGDDEEALGKGDRVVIKGDKYRIRHIQPFCIGGVNTFTRLQLKTEN
jgi:hypothetical protein